MSDIEFSDEQLVAYLDGETDHAPMDQIAMALRTNTALAKRLEALRIDTKQVAQSLASCLETSSAPPVFTQHDAKKNWAMPTAAAAVVALMIGFGVGHFITKPATPDWKDYVAAYHFLYTTNTLNAVQSTTDSQQSELDRVSASIGKTIPAAVLKQFPEVDYKRAQLLGYKGKPLVQLTFLSRSGEPIAFCMLRASDAEDGDIHMLELEGMSTANWRSNGYDFLLIGGQDQRLIKRIAEKLRAIEI
ncbi:MAG: hypothetical protein AAFO77_07210 [Pseudomonadota bacterium]